MRYKPPAVYHDTNRMKLEEVGVGSQRGALEIDQRYAGMSAGQELELSIHDSLFFHVDHLGRLKIAKIINGKMHLLQGKLEVSDSFRLSKPRLVFRFSDQKAFDALGWYDVTIPTGLGDALANTDGGKP